MKKAIFCVAIAWCVAILSGPATAQVDFQISSDFVTSTALGNVMISQLQSLNGGSGRRRSKGKSGRGKHALRSTGSPPSKLRGSTRFRPSLATRRSFLAAVVARTRASNPQGAAALQRDFAANDPIFSITPALARYGLRTDDVADTTAAYLISAWYGVRGSNQDPSRTILRATREQVRRALLSTPSFSSASNVAKQQMSDALLLQLIGTDQLVTKAKGNPTQMAQVKTTIRQNALRTFRLDLSKMKLTNQGLRA